MYDLILCVITSEKSKRLSFFQKIGYKKSAKYKTKVVYLADNKNAPSYIIVDWIDCSQVVGSGYTCRFVSYLKNTQDKAKWILQVDDDSCTDLEKTIDFLNGSYDYEDPVALTGSFSFHLRMPRYIDRQEDLSPCFSYMIDHKLQKVLKDMNIENLFIGTNDLNKTKIMPFMVRGWEQSVFSWAALNKIKKYDKTQEFVSRCAEINPDFSDQVPFVLAKLAKIPIAQCFFLTPTPNIEEYTGINKNGRFSHVHHISESWDQLQVLEKLLDSNVTFESSLETDSYFDSQKENTQWLFFHIFNDQIAARCLIKLLPQNKIKVLDVVFTGLVSCCPTAETKLNLNEKKYNLENKNWFFNEEKRNFIIKNEFDQELIFNLASEKLYQCKVSTQNYYILSRVHTLDQYYWSRGLFIGTGFQRIN